MTSNQRIRTSFIFIIFCALYAVIIFNLYFIQIIHADFYKNLGSSQYNITLTQYPPRAEIIDRSSNPLALNKDCVSAFILPRQIKNPDTLKPFLKKHFPNAYIHLSSHPNKQFMFIQRKLSREQQDLIANQHITDIKLLSEPNRFYPLYAAAPIIGITDIDNKGLFGIELYCNTHLAGTAETCFLEKDARSGYFYFTKKTKIHAKQGNPVQLTLDSNLQFLVEDTLKQTLEKYEAHEGTALIMNPTNGDILAMVTLPHYDPNDNSIDNLELTKNKVISDSYERGSVFKIFTALAALEEKVVTPEEPIDCKNQKTAYLDGRKINTVKAHGVLPFKEVVAFSNNIGIATVAKRLGDKLYDHYIRLGFGNKTAISFPGEASGFVNHPSNWSKQSIISLSYGYEISATLLQLGCAFCIIANGGKKIQPRLFMNQVIEKIPQLYNPETIATIQEILEHTTEHGTTRRSRIKGYKVMSKTGTANMLIDGKYHENKNLFTCAGIVQKDEYQRVIVVFVKEAKCKGLYAAQVAAPLFEQIAQRVLIHDRVI